MAVQPYRHICRQPGCGALIENKGGYCSRHRTEYERQRGSASKRGYDARWRKARLEFLKENPICNDCKDELATLVDHIIPHKGSREIFWDEDNWQGLCASCHSRKTAREDGRWGNKK